MGLSGEPHARYEVVWKLSDKEPEAIEAENWIAKKGIAAKGKKCAERGEVKTVRFVEPLVIDEPEPEEQESEEVMEPAPAPEPIPAPKPKSKPAPAVLPAVEPEPPADLSDVPDFPGGLFDEPTLF